jgi:hypothetical protein
MTPSYTLPLNVTLLLKCYSSTDVLSFEVFSASLSCNLKQRCNNLMYTLILSLYAFCVVFAYSRFVENPLI